MPDALAPDRIRPSAEATDRRAPQHGPVATMTGDGEPLSFLTFSLGGQYFALSVAPVREILDEQPVAVLPDAPPDVLGLIDVRGEGVPVIDVSQRLGVVAAADRDRRIVVIEQPDGDGRPVGVFADEVLSVIEIAAEGIEHAPRHGSSAAASSDRAPLLCGVARMGGRLVMVLDHRRLVGATSDDLFDFGQ